MPVGLPPVDACLPIGLFNLHGIEPRQFGEPCAAPRMVSRLFVLLVVAAGCAGTPYRRSPWPPRPPSEPRSETPVLAGRAVEGYEQIPHAPGTYFRAEAFHEDAFAGRHEHGLVRLLDIPILVVRDEDVFRTPPDRAREIARILQEALHMGDRFFVVGDEAGLPTIYSVSHHGGFPRLVLRVTRGDAVSYGRRSGRDIDQHLLADWWVAVLRDVLAAVFLNEAPRFTSVVGTSRALEELRAELWDSGQAEPVSPDGIRAAGTALSPETRRALRILAFTVPPAFTGLPQDEGGGHEGR